MTHDIRTLKAKTLQATLAGVLLLTTSFLVACGGSSDKPAASATSPAQATPSAASATSTPQPTVAPTTPPAPTPTPFVIAGISSTDALVLQTDFYQAVFNAMTGAGKAEDVVKFYSPECRATIPVARFQTALDDLRKAQPKLNGQKVEQLSLGSASVGSFNNTRPPNIAIALPRADKVTLKAAGKATNVDDFMAEFGIGFIASRLDNVLQTLVVVDGKPYVAGCNNVRIWGSDIGFGNFANLAPEPKTPTPVATSARP